ncbi:MAG: P-loop containing nucleoside triphosphate hydrolase protein [Linnemannia gamsii]|nr:MAG: P-loop containing nucleoside triphosphate hydrolase protein [Linnemannia gamsii]
MLIAPCGWGKTLAFFLPMIYWPGRITAIISPLIALMNDQQQKLVKAKIPHIVLSGDNSDAINGDMIRRIYEGEFRAVFMSPEIIFGDTPTSKSVKGLWQDPRWRNLLLAIVVDEVHCVEKWGNDFRKVYGRLGDLRVWSPGVPFVGVTATLTADALTQTMDKLFLSEARVIRVQEMPTNVRLEVHTQPKDAMWGLSRLLGNDKTIIYFEKISILVKVHSYLCVMKPELEKTMGVYYSTLYSLFKEETMSKFINNEIHILLATEAAGMGCDIPDVVQVIQYGFPRDMPSLVQRFGRAARDPKIQGFGILYAPPITRTSPSDKNVREYLMNQAGGCLWKIIDILFGKDVRTCNNSCSGCFQVDRPVPATVRHNTRSSNNRRRWPSRSKEEKHMAFKKLVEWRENAFERWVSSQPFRYGSELWILPNSTAKQLSQRFSGARTAKAVKAIACNWMPLGGNKQFGEVAQVLDKFNNEIDASRGSNSQTTASAIDQLEDGFDGDREGSDDDEDLLES